MNDEIDPSDLHQAELDSQELERQAPSGIYGSVYLAHPEAFCLMQYDSDDGTETEVLWNSRDGVTPFVLTLKSGKQGTHNRWSEDVQVSENMARALGVRWFSDHTEETARAGAIRYVEKFWNHQQIPMSHMWSTKEVAVEYFVQEWVGSPTILECPGPPHGREPKVSKFSEVSKFGGPR